MVQNNPIPEDEPIESYDELVTEEPEREVSIEEYKGVKTVSEEEEEGELKSDVKYILRTLTPRFPDKKLDALLQPVMVSRIFPDNMMDSCKMTVLSRLQSFEPSDNTIDPWSIILATHNAHSIGFEGRGIIDRLEIAGVAREEELEKLSKDLGL